MSAYMVDRHHIRYLIEAAKSKRICPYGFSWRHNGQAHAMPHGTEGEVKLANMLWSENMRSINYRYPNDTIATMPGPIGESYVFDVTDYPLLVWNTFDPLQVVKACDCYEYQSCEHPEWETSEAKAFVDHLRHCAPMAMAAYDKAEWGAPAPRLWGEVWNPKQRTEV